MGIFNKKQKAVKIHTLAELEPMIETGKPILLDFFQIGCAPCQVMDGIMNELAREYGDSAHVVKVDVAKVAGAAQTFQVRSTPTFVLLSKAEAKVSKKARKRGVTEKPNAGKMSARWRTSGLVKKDQLQRMLESNGAERVSV
ncbi:MAG: thioredoxin family protein [Acidimicrobiia bacterium]|nr:thioredoxin family protein [Acidimicrobiia bacterium]MBT8214216.1 thioredoxin family protein [Acidimicrobiia bacterium]NNF69613.1 thioredoxin family protein [Acidimicrobiia bacterium]NNK92004.1 thioredoxin family protein [Acidimicrobiia bacterium]